MDGCELAVDGSRNCVDGGGGMKIMNIAVYGLNESLIRSAYPMSTVVNEAMETTVQQYGITEDLVKRGKALGNAKGGSGHDCFLKGIMVQMDCKFPQYLWQQAKRYHWFDFVSSQSTMHCILKFDLDAMHHRTDQRIIEVTKEYIAIHRDNPTDENFENILANTAQGLCLTAGISTNYLQLKTMYFQRESHRLPCWQYFKEFCEALPYFKELCIGGKQ